MTHDAVVIGAGPNGLVAANLLADHGWSVLVLEEQAAPGGAVRSDRDVHEDFVHDTFSSFYPLTAASPIIGGLDLGSYGLQWTHAPAVVGHPTPDGGWAVLHRDRERTAHGLEAVTPGDGEAWLRLSDTWDRIEAPLLAALFAPLPPLRATPRLLAAVARTGGLEVVRTLLLPAVDLVRRFRGPAPGLLLAGNAAHADLPLASPGSGFFGLLLCMLGQRVGYPVPVGGAQMITDALVARLEARGGVIACGHAVEQVLVEAGRAVGVRTADGERHRAGTVVADTSLPALFGELLAPEHVPAHVRRQTADFRWDPGTVKVDWALSGPVPWEAAPVTQPGTVHVAGSVSEMTNTLTQVASGVVPAHPLMLVGQTTTADPTRSPSGTEALWSYAHVPQPDETVVDSGEGGIRGIWDHDDRERFADRMQARIEALAPGFSERVLARRVLGPHELERRNRNLVGGALNGGTAQLHQQLVLRPLPAMRGRAETGLPGLYLASAAAHPGGAVHGAPGHHAARAALAHGRLRGLVPGRRR
jgi:phytoene dehydrogenase-like protein